MRDGRFYKEEVSEVLAEAKRVLSCPHRAVKTVIDLDIPFSRYSTIPFEVI